MYTQLICRNGKQLAFQEAILDYCHRGYPVVPLAPGKKTPITPNGHKDATSDPVHAQKLFNRNDLNIGIATGPAGLGVLDVDGPTGVASLTALCCAHGELPLTYTVSTRTKYGRHYYFKAPKGRLIRCSVGKLGPGLDIRAQGGYVVAPPSWVEADHKGPSGFYRVLLDAPVADLPDWLAQLLAPAPCSTQRQRKLTQITPETPRQIAILKDLLSHISADCDYERYRNVVWGILSTGWNCAEQLALEWSMTAEHRFEQRTFDALVRSFDPSRPISVTYGTLAYLARLGGRRE